LKIASEKIEISCPESEIIERLLSLDNKHILDLGCGNDGTVEPVQSRYPTGS